MSEITIISIDEFRPVVLAVLADGQVYSRSQVAERAADFISLGPEERAHLLPSGDTPTYVHRVGWALSSFKMAGLVRQPKRGWYQITEDGLTVHARGLTRYTEKELAEWPAWRAYQAEVAERKAGPKESTRLIESGDSKEADPIESMDSLHRELNTQVETDLRRRLQDASPEFFEKAVLELLWAMGYGGRGGAKEHLGKSGDGGLDGVIRQDPLGLSKVFVQAKRYADGNTVGAGEMRNFIGALDSHGASQGVFITTSRFAQGAVTAATNYRHGTIVMIDGLELTRLMLSYQVAVQSRRSFVVYEIDEDFFEPDGQ
ncbi:restriction endonuclease [Boudabousia liubingyangii]|uniref:Restriction endonuclease n=1 Tax=Boudabousia liubingyangii TaxID=1921764 RepID=A0A1Q5PJM0_9ACTO|nr:restriction endonuclease [Boudabousia liubingyangii]OKL46124.1 restriction endonuclease [Boudabousia liubingyangii]